MEKLPISLFYYLGEFLELKDIGNLSRCCETLHNNINKDKIFYHYSRKRYQVDRLPEEFKTWKEFVKEYSDLKWNKHAKNVQITNNNKAITSNGWGCAITNLSFRKGKHFMLMKIHKYGLGFLGIAFEDTKLEGPCGGGRCFAYSSFYRDPRDPTTKGETGTIYKKQKKDQLRELWKEGGLLGIYLDLDNKEMSFCHNGKISEEDVVFENLPEGKYHFYFSGVSRDSFEIVSYKLFIVDQVSFFQDIPNLFKQFQD